jgi:enoyl-CoA hydratase/carnithine racemase
MEKPMSAERTEEETVAFTVESGIAWVKFNRPEKRNCMSPKLNRQMKKVLEEIEFREDVKVLVLTGEGKAWSASLPSSLLRLMLPQAGSISLSIRASMARLRAASSSPQ